MKSVILTSAYLAPIQYYSKLYAAPQVVEEQFDHYVKQTYRNRCIIAGPNGPQALTFPIEHTELLKPCTKDIRLSDHGNWRHLHWNALQSAYDKSPYFEYYADDFRPFYENKYEYLVDFNDGLRDLVCQELGLSPQIQRSTAYVDADPDLVLDFRESIRPKVDYTFDKSFRIVPYYQVFAQKQGFQPNLSIVDLLFNMGPESRLVLRDSCV